MSNKKRYYFAYGANLNKHSMKWRCPTAKPVSAFMLRDWELEFYSHATIIPSPGNSVPGALWELEPEDELALDSFEGFPSYYSKREITQSGKTFFIYVMNKYREGKPTKEYLETILEGYKDFNLPELPFYEAVKKCYPQTQIPKHLR